MIGLPAGWALTTVGELTTLVNGKAFKPSDWSEAGLPIVRIQNLNKTGAKFNYYDGDVENRFIIEHGDLLFAWSGTPGTSFGAHVWRGQTAVLNQHIFNVRFDRDLIDTDFLRHAINQTLDEQIAKAHGGVGLRHVTKGKFEDTNIWLPPLPEQQRIVAKIDSLTSKSRRARDQLDHIPRLVDKYKQAILDGLYRQLPERSRLLDHVLSDRGITYGIVQTGDAVTEGVPTVRCGDIKNFRADRAHLKRVSPKIEEAYPRTRLRGGEVLIAIRGSVGETCVASTDLQGCNVSREVAVIPLVDGAVPEFYMFFLATSEAKQFILTNVKGVAQQGINLRDLRELPTPRVSPTLQVQIASRVGVAFAWVDRLAAQARSARRLIHQLDQAVLAKAFRGELVPQDPTDEPASVLLERIRAERAEAGTVRVRRARRA